MSRLDWPGTFRERRRPHVPLLALALSTLAALAPGQLLYVDGEMSSPAAVGVGHAASVDLAGPPSAPLLAVVGFTPLNLATPYGTLGLDLTDPGVFAYLDGFSPAHPAHAVSHVGPTGIASWIQVPFVGPSVPPITTFLTQAIVADPSAPAGATLTNCIVVNALLPAPAIHATSQNIAAPGAVLMLSGTGFVPAAAGNAVSVEGHAWTLLSATTSTLTVAVPPDACSGPFRITTGGGSTEAWPENIDTWCAILPPAVPEAAAPPVVASGTTIQGTISAPNEVDVFRIGVAAGEGLAVEAYAFDPAAARVTASSPTTSALDPRIEIRRGGLVLADDDESGPGPNAAIGLPRGTSFFVADVTGEYEVLIRGTGIGTVGAYLLALRTMPPTGYPLQVSALGSSLAHAGDPLAIHATGFDPASPTLGVELDGRPCPILGRSVGRLDIVVPTGAHSGPIVVRDGAASSPEDRDRMSAWLTILGQNSVTAIEGHVEALLPGDSGFGRIDGFGDQDRFRFTAAARHRYRIEASAMDLASGTVVTGVFGAGGVLDPEILVFAGRDTVNFLAVDGNSGPGLNALLDPASGSAFFVPETGGDYDVLVQAFGHATTGDYVLRVVDLGP